MLVKHNGLWKEATPLVKEAGAWKPVAAAYVKEGGVWKETYAAAPAGPSGPVEFWPTAASGWTNSESIISDNGSAAYYNLNNGYFSAYLYANAWNIADTIPSTAVIKGLKVEFEHQGYYDLYYGGISLRELKIGSIKTDTTVRNTPNAFAKVTLGGSTDLWGKTPAALLTALRASNFNIRFRYYSSINARRIDVDYVKVILYF